MPENRLRDFLITRQQAYKRTFDGPFGLRVLKDLAQFCRARRTTFNPDSRMHAVLEGRREVWLRIQEHLHMTDKELWRQIGGSDE